MRLSTVLLLTVSASTCFAQGQPVRPEPHWTFGDRRRVTITNSVKVAIKDSILQQENGTAVLHYEVTDLRKDLYVLQAQGDAVAGLIGDMSAWVLPLPEVQRDSTLKRLKRSLTDSYAELLRRTVSVKLDRSGKILETLDGDKDKERVRAALVDAVVKLQNLSREDKRHTGQELQVSGEHWVDSVTHVVERAHDANVRFILEPYAYLFPASGSDRQPTTLNGSEVPSLEGAGELPAVMEWGLDEATETTLVARVVITCDADAVLKVLLARDPKNTTKKQDVALVKETVYTLDRTTGWLTKSTSSTRLRVGTLRALRTANSVVSPEIAP